ncbi:MAG: hypothetical protein J0H42_26850 [Rhizobiales bacterium]|nr:hypothetical protein [Hyphomicrobiales bacterium]
MSIDPEEPYSVAKGYVQAAYAMMTNPHRMQLEDDTSLFMAFHMLCGFAAELYLKAFLVKKGYSEAQLRKRELRHDLVQLRALCHSSGLFNTGADQLVDLLAQKHKTFEFRYMKKSSEYRTMDLQLIFLAFSSLDQIVDKIIGASASRGKMPRGGWTFPDDGPWRLPGLMLTATPPNPR